MPRNLNEIPEYVAIKFGVSDKRKKKDLMTIENSFSFVQIVYFSKEKAEKFPNEEMGENNKEKVLFEQNFDSEQLNFSDEDMYSVRIHYNNENLEIFLSDSGSEIEPLEGKHHIKLSIKLAKLLNLEMGKGYVGFIQDSRNGTFGIDFLNWKMVFFLIYFSII